MKYACCACGRKEPCIIVCNTESSLNSINLKSNVSKIGCLLNKLGRHGKEKANWIQVK